MLVVAGDVLRRREVERALVELDAVGQEELFGERLHFTLAALVDDRVELARHEQRAHEHRALVALAEPAGVENLRRVHLDLEALGHLHLGDRELVGRRRDREGGDRRHLRARTGLRPPDGPERSFFLLLLGERRKREQREHQEGGGERQCPAGQRRWSHSDPPWATAGVTTSTRPSVRSMTIDDRSWPRTLARTAAARKDPRSCRIRAAPEKGRCACRESRRSPPGSRSLPSTRRFSTRSPRAAAVCAVLSAS